MNDQRTDRTMDRRQFLHRLGLLSGATLLTSCGSEKGQQDLISYLVPPEDGVTPGEARWIPSTCGECPAGCGVLVRLREGRAVKLEGLPGHPVNDGALCMRGQAALWRLYHPERLRTPLRRGENGSFAPVDWEEALALVAGALSTARREGQRNLLLAGRTTGSLSNLLDQTCSALGMERLPDFELYGHPALRMANGLLFGRPDIPHYHLEKADFLLTLGADLLETFVSPVEQTRQLARAAESPGFTWVHLEPHCSLTGVNAHRRMTLRAGSEALLLAFLLGRLAPAAPFRDRLPPAVRQHLPAVTAPEAAAGTGLPLQEIEGLAASLAAARRPLLVAGGVATGQPRGLETAVLAGLLQWTAGMVGGTVDFSRGANYEGVGSLKTLRDLSQTLAGDGAGLLLFSRVDPLLHAPADFGLSGALGRAQLRVALAERLDGTARSCDLVLPLAHPLETWGDAEVRRGLFSLVQPASPPEGESLGEGDILLALWRQAGGGPGGNFRHFLEQRWRRGVGEAGAKELISRGFSESTSRESSPTLRVAEAAGFLRTVTPGTGADGPVLVIPPSIRRFDGRGLALPLLSEIPDPLTTVSYGQWLSVSPREAARLGVVNRDGLILAAGAFAGELPAVVQPGLPEGVLAIQRDLADTSLFQADPQTGEPLSWLPVTRLETSRRSHPLAILAGSTSQQGRGLIPDPVHRDHPPGHGRRSLYPEHPHPDLRWAMAIDLGRCTGCGACVAACHAENNIPVAGEKDHLQGREMSWLRIEPFYDAEGRPEFLPMLCQHCHYAPCEPVCPVYAAYHNPEGLNVQVYNRCVGTRYCSNNCPYKVRRFNWWDHPRKAPLDRMLNPDLSVRTRGMMEKCTFCIQRIRAGHDRARDEGRPILDGEVVTACAQTCPSGAIVFGNLKDESSRIARLTAADRAYRVFEHLGTEPSVYYLRPDRAGRPEPEA